MVEYIGFAAGTLTVLSFLPQAVQAWRTKHVQDVSFAMIALLMAGASVWIIYGVVTRDMPVIMTNAIAMVFQAAIMGAKLRFQVS
ncbi:MAG: SemiSWEET family sugar transporter [Gemmatimonadota bacterium]